MTLRHYFEDRKAGSFGFHARDLVYTPRSSCYCISAISKVTGMRTATLSRPRRESGRTVVAAQFPHQQNRLAIENLVAAGTRQQHLPRLAPGGNIHPNFRRSRPAALPRQRRVAVMGPGFPCQANAVGTKPVGIGARPLPGRSRNPASGSVRRSRACRSRSLFGQDSRRRPRERGGSHGLFRRLTGEAAARSGCPGRAQAAGDGSGTASARRVASKGAWPCLLCPCVAGPPARAGENAGRGKSSGPAISCCCPLLFPQGFENAPCSDTLRQGYDFTSRFGRRSSCQTRGIR